MYYWQVNTEILNSARKKKANSVFRLVDMAIKAFVLHISEHGNSSNNLVEEIKHIPVQLIIDILVEMCNFPKLMKIQRMLLINPLIVDRILRQQKDNKVKLVKCFQWLEVFDNVLVSDMAYCCYHSKTDSYQLGYEEYFRIGTFLMETGWHNEAINVLEVAKQQTCPSSLQHLNVMSSQLLSKTYVGHPSAYDTSVSIQEFIDNNNNIPKSFLASLYLAMSIFRYDNNDFINSHTYALMALSLLLKSESTNRLIIEVFCHLAKTCLSQKQTKQAKLMITQAVSRAWHNYGPLSVIYAKTLENYALYLVMMNSFDDGYTVFSEAVNVLMQVYGPQNLRRSVTKGNLSFDLYFNCAYIYSDLHMAKNYVQTQIEINPIDRRIVEAAKRVFILLEADIVRYGAVRCYDEVDKFEPVQEQLSVEVVRRLFNNIKNNSLD